MSVLLKLHPLFFYFFQFHCVQEPTLYFCFCWQSIVMPSKLINLGCNVVLQDLNNKPQWPKVSLQLVVWRFSWSRFSKFFLLFLQKIEMSKYANMLLSRTCHAIVFGVFDSVTLSNIANWLGLVLLSVPLIWHFVHDMLGNENQRNNFVLTGLG